MCFFLCAADNRKHLHQHNVEKVLVDLLTPEGEDACVKTATCKAVHAMSFHESSRDTLGELGTQHCDDAALLPAIQNTYVSGLSCL